MASIGSVPAVPAFVALARRYCAVVEGRDPLDPVGFLRGAQPLLAALCHAALSLPELGDIELPDDAADADYGGDAFIAEWRPLHEALTDELDPDTYYWEVFDPYDAADPPEPIEGSLADDLADIYMDLVRPLRRWDAADDRVRASLVWEWRFQYEGHWGHHAIDALRAIHTLLYVHHIGEDAMPGAPLERRPGGSDPGPGGIALGLPPAY